MLLHDHRGARWSGLSVGTWSTYQKRCPHKLITASLAVSKQMLHSKVLSWFVFSPAPLLLLLPLVPPVLELFVDVEVVGPLLAILRSCTDTRSRKFSCWNPKNEKGKKKKPHTLLALQHCILDLLQTGSDLPKKHLNPPVDGFSLTYPRDNFAL